MLSVAMANYEDPGWRPVFRAMGRQWLSFGMSSRRRTREVRSGGMLVPIRLIVLGVVMAVLLFVQMLTFIESRLAPDAGRAWVSWAVLAVGLIFVAALGVIRARPLDASSGERLLTTYKASLFIEIGLAEAPALLGLAVSLLVRARLPYLAGLGPSLAGFALLAPTRRDIERRQQQVDEQGSTLSLGRLLTTPREPAG